MKNRYRKFCVERSYYFESHDKDGNIRPDAPSVEEWKSQVVTEWTDLYALGAEKCLLIFHDLDTHPDTGEQKPLHAHGVVSFVNPHSESGVAELMGVTNSRNCKRCSNFSGAVQYLIHVTQDALADMKHVYSPDAVIGYALDERGEKIRMSVQDVQRCMRRKTSKKKAEDDDAVVSELLLKVCHGELLITDVQHLYESGDLGTGFNLVKFFKHESMYISAEKKYLQACARFYQEHEHPMALVYITGIGGTGKTQLAREFAKLVADRRGFHEVGAPGKSTTFDFASLYNGQRSSFVDEFKPDSMPLEQFLSVFDPLRSKVVNSRNYEKLYFPDYVVFSASMDLEELIYQMWRPYAQTNAHLGTRTRQCLLNGSTESDWHNAYINSKNGRDIANKFAQFRRRFAAYVVLDGGFAKIFILNDSVNPSYSLLHTDPVRFPSVQPFIHFTTCVYDPSQDRATFQRQKLHAANRILDAIRKFYEINGFVSPEDCPRPFDDCDQESDQRSVSRFGSAELSDRQQSNQAIDWSEFVQLPIDSVD